MTARYELINYKDELHILYHTMNYIKAGAHWHTELEIIFVFSGKLNLTIDGKDYLLSSKEFAVINSGQIHSCESLSSEQGNYALLQLNAQFFKNLHIDIQKVTYQNLYSSHKDSASFDSNVIQILDATTQIKSALTLKKDDYKSEITLTCCQILNKLKEQPVSRKPSSTGSDSPFQNVERMKRIIHFMEQHYTEPLSIEDVADREHISTYYLSHLFKKYTTSSFAQYLNFYRISKVEYDLTHSDDSITEIYLRHGFNNGKTFNRVFKNTLNCSPSEYRSSKRKQTVSSENAAEDIINTGIGTYINYHEHRLPKVQENVISSTNDTPASSPSAELSLSESFSVCVDFESEGTYYEKYQQKITGTGRANDFLKAEFQKQFTAIQKEFHFNHIRFFGIFDREMDVVRKEDGQLYFNFYHVDEVFDFILSVSCRPYLTLGFMPDALKSTEKAIYFYNANVSPASSMQDWSLLVTAFMEHIVKRYGISEVSQWIFEIWNEPDIDFFTGTFSQYLDLYYASYHAIRTSCPHALIGGPSLSSNVFEHPDCLTQFMDFCMHNNCQPDFISVHPYPIKMELIPGTARMQMLHHTKHYLSKAVSYMKNLLSSPVWNSIPLHMNEWNSTPDIVDLTHDTAFMATFIIQNVLSNLNSIDTLCYWCLSDLIDELGVPRHEFCGSFGLLTRSGLKKPSFFGMWALSMLSCHYLINQEHIIVTKSDSGVQILLYNYCHYNTGYASGDKSMLSYYDRYKVFDSEPPLSFHVEITSLPDSIMEITRYDFDRNHGSVFDLWIKNGAPECPTHKQLEFLNEQNHLNQSHKYLTVKDGNLILEATIPPFGFTLFDIVFS